MASLTVRTDQAMETALRALAGKERSRSDAVPHTCREMLIEQAQEDAVRLSEAPSDQAELLAIQRFMGVAE